MSTETLVTVIIPTRNRLAYLREAAGSVLGSTGDEVELVIVDDASDDGTWEWLSSLDGRRVRAFRNESPLERCEARNVGLGKARGEFVLFLDDDDRIRGAGLRAMVRALAAEPRAIAAVGGWVRFDGRGNRLRGPQPRRAQSRPIVAELFSGLWAAIPGRSLFPSSRVRAIGGWTAGLEGMGEEHELWARLSGMGPVVFVPQTVLEYRLHPGQWRPVPARRRNIMGEAMDQLPAPVQKQAARSRRAGRQLGPALVAYDEGRYTEAAYRLFSAARAAPALVRSPLTRSLMLGTAAKATLGALLGRRASESVRSWRSELRRWTRRDAGRRRNMRIVRR